MSSLVDASDTTTRHHRLALNCTLKTVTGRSVGFRDDLRKPGVGWVSLRIKSEPAPQLLTLSVRVGGSTCWSPERTRQRTHRGDTWGAVGGYSRRGQAISRPPRGQSRTCNPENSATGNLAVGHQHTVSDYPRERNPMA